ncbi:hypothetical protein B4064_0325 [Caldibacillus thermoamylovorans]|uniref:Uncharacterized protein n=1 Tax=Caldibacillus thermoamylovorans TaxID=35841 RepID=A0A0D0ER30_9BACI|nr:hypothetical protein B4166_0919 [Caldibacillus thermoamylovorans]KIO62851.1 hypothetical protein B4064_0325 [Caldibacillus thermoamylovorans]KIO67467.1 hypothetical protein B4065_0349 [Caldibacillus thermoamylovorans]KIO70262.1 hypothetical protein B4167_0954 [Caldibacillus thermoamylovorans]
MVWLIASPAFFRNQEKMMFAVVAFLCVYLILEFASLPEIYTWLTYK